MNEELTYVRIGEACGYYSVNHSTIRRWASTGKIPCRRMPSGHRLIAIPANGTSRKSTSADRDRKEQRSVILYTRVSSNKQKDDLQRQQEYLQNKYKEKIQERNNAGDKSTNQEENNIIHFHDIASGLNFKRRGLIKVLDAVKNGKVQAVVVASKDRLARFGFDLIEWICSEYGTEIMVLDDKHSTPTEELGTDLLSIIQIYCCKWNGQRRYRNPKQNKEVIEVETLSNEATTTDA